MNHKEKKKNLIQHLITMGYLKSPKVIKAFEEVPRENFVGRKYKEYAYADEPLPIACGQTISAPHMVAVMTELLEPKKTDKILEIGTGSGYQAAVLSRLVEKVCTVEFFKELAEFAKENLKKIGARNVEVICRDGSKGYPKKAPYDKIIVTCGCPEIPKALVWQLKEGGIIVIPVGGGWHQNLIVGVKRKGKLETRNWGGCMFVPLKKL